MRFLMNSGTLPQAGCWNSRSGGEQHCAGRLPCHYFLWAKREVWKGSRWEFNEGLRVTFACVGGAWKARAVRDRENRKPSVAGVDRYQILPNFSH